VRSAQRELAFDIATMGALVSPATQERLADCLVDFLASILTGAQTSIGRFVARVYAGEGSRGYAFALAYIAEISEFSHGSNRSAGHVGSTTLPVVLAAARERGRHPADLAASALGGYEAFSRVGSSMMPALERWGSVQTGFVGSLGAAAAAARLRGLDVEGICSALGTAAYLTPLTPVEGNLSSANSSEAATATDVGMRAAELVEGGVYGSPRLVDDLYRRVVGQTPPSAFRSPSADRRLGIHQLYFKPFPSCRFTHGAIQAVLEVLRQGVRVEDVFEVEVDVTPRAFRVCGALPRRAPTQYLERQFSLHYMTALTLLSGQVTPAEVFAPSSALDEAALSFAQTHVRLQMREELAELGHICPAHLTFYLRDGTTLQHEVSKPWGSPDAPLSRADLLSKFERAAVGTLSAAEVETWQELAGELAWLEISDRLHNLLAHALI
jgi:2-methylcitrate dehydratase PrpD